MKKLSGYTLIELLVAITVISIVFAIGYASFREFSRRQALTGIVRSVTSDLRLAQQLSLTGEKPETGSCTTLEGYSFAPNSGNYTVTANCSNADRLIKTVTLESGVTISGPTVQFKVLGQGTNLNSTATLTINHSVLGNSVTITVGKGGEVK